MSGPGTDPATLVAEALDRAVLAVIELTDRRREAGLSSGRIVHTPIIPPEAPELRAALATLVDYSDNHPAAPVVWEHAALAQDVVWAVDELRVEVARRIGVMCAEAVTS